MGAGNSRSSLNGNDSVDGNDAMWHSDVSLWMHQQHPEMECKDQITRAPDTEYDDVLVECSSSQSNHRRSDSLHSVLCGTRSVVLCVHSKCHEQCDSSV